MVAAKEVERPIRVELYRLMARFGVREEDKVLITMYVNDLSSYTQ